MIFPSPTPPATKSNAEPAYYRLSDVVRISALSRSTIYRRIAEGRFPSPVSLGGKASGWARDDIRRWVINPTAYRVPKPPSGVQAEGDRGTVAR